MQMIWGMWTKGQEARRPEVITPQNKKSTQKKKYYKVNLLINRWVKWTENKLKGKNTCTQQNKTKKIYFAPNQNN